MCNLWAFDSCFYRGSTNLLVFQFQLLLRFNIATGKQLAVVTPFKILVLWHQGLPVNSVPELPASVEGT